MNPANSRPPFSADFPRTSLHSVSDRWDMKECLATTPREPLCILHSKLVV